MFKRRTPFLMATGALLLAVLFWGMAPVANRYLLASLSPGHLLILRFVAASVLFFPMVLQMRKHRWSRSDVLRAIFCGLASILGYQVALIYGLQWVQASMAGLLFATEALWIALLSRVILHEPLHGTALVGLTLGIVGLVTLVGWTVSLPEHHTTTFFGIGLIIFASFMWAVYTVAVRPLSRKYGAPVSTSLTTILGTLPLLLLWDSRLLPSVAALSLSDWFAFVLLALGASVIATFLWNYGVAKLPGAQAGIFLNIQPFVSVLGGSLFLQERLTPGMPVGGLIIMASVVVTQLPSFTAQRQRALKRQQS